MATVSSVSTTSLPSSPSMNSSHSSEGSYVLVDNSSNNEHSEISQSREDAKHESLPKSESMLEGGSVPQGDLMEKVQSLTKENEELKGVLLQNNKLLEEYFQDLANMQKNQKQTNETLRKGYDHAKEVVKKLREKNVCLQAELRNEQDKNMQLEEQMAKQKDAKLNESSPQHGDNQSSPGQVYHSSPIQVNHSSHSQVDHSSPSQVNHSSPSQVQSLKEVIKRLESEKVTLEINNSKLQEHISCVKAIREAEPNIEGDECETLVSLGPFTLPSDQLSVETMQDKYNKLQTEKVILQVDLEKMKIENEQKQQQYQQMEEVHNILVQKLAELEQKLAAEAENRQEMTSGEAATESGQKDIKELSQQLEVQTEVLARLKEGLDTVTQEKEMYKKKVEGLEQMKESVWTEQAVSENQQLETENRDADKVKEEIVKLTQERDAYKKKVDEFQSHLKEAEASAEDAFGKVEDTEIKEKYVELKNQLLTFERREAEILARESVLYLERENAQRQESAEKEEIERLKQLLLNYEEKEKEGLEAAKKQAASQAELAKETSKLKQQLETERTEFGKQIDSLIRERDTYKVKAEEFQAQPTEESKTAEDALGTVGDTDLKQKFVKVRSQLWNYQKRENDILNRENALLEKEDAAKQLLKEKEDLQLQLAEALTKAEALTQEKQKQEEEARTMERQLSETHEHEVLLLKEELQTKNTEMETVQTNEEQLKAHVTKLVEENKNLVMECEKCKADCTKQEEEAQTLKRQLSETHEREVLLLKEELETKHTAMAKVQTSEEHLKAQVTQLIQENEALMVELERLKEDLQQQENMYQDHLHKVTQDSEHQRQRRDDIIKALKTQLSTVEGELQKTRSQHMADGKVFHQLKQEHERVMAEYQELVQSYNTTLDTTKEHERSVGQLRAHLDEADDHEKKLKEDILILEEKLSELREKAFNLQRLEEQFPILEAQLEVYRGDFQVEREAREKQHEEITRLREEIQHLQQENQHYQDEIDRLGNASMAEMQRRHGSYVPEPQGPQQPRGWFDAVFPIMFPRGGMDTAEIPRNPEGNMQSGQQIPDRVQVGGYPQQQGTGPAEEEDWICPTCRRTFPNFDSLQIHAVECNAPQAAPTHQCPKCMEIFPEYDTLEIHVMECLERE